MVALVAERLGQLKELCRQFHVERLELFGSAAEGGFEPGRSDVDFLVKFATATPAEHADCYFGLTWALEELLGCRVDLLEPQVIRNPYLQRAIDKQRELLYAA